MPLEALGDGRARISAPLTDEDVRHLHTGEVALVSGTVVAARDTAHRRFAELLEAGEDLPFDPRGAILYYAGPTPARPGNVVGAIGPTTASRLDRFTPALLEAGVKCLVGKGGRGPEVREALRRHTAVYLAALGGGGALAARRVRGARVIAFEELGTEAGRELDLDDLPAWVVNDAEGRDFYQETKQPWRRDELLPEELRVDRDG
jgi:fumarate hydratase subunit beta